MFDKNVKISSNRGVNVMILKILSLKNTRKVGNQMTAVWAENKYHITLIVMKRPFFAEYFRKTPEKVIVASTPVHTFRKAPNLNKHAISF
jgi:hypothetical protein